MKLQRPVMGVDLSLTSTGVVVVGRKVMATVLLETKPNKDEPDKNVDSMKRMDFTCEGVMTVASNFMPELVVLETGSFGHGDSRPHELNGIVKLALYRAGYRVALVAANTLKKAATGSGAASKTEMIRAAEAEGFVLPCTERGALRAGADDLADAYHLARWGQRTIQV